MQLHTVTALRDWIAGDTVPSAGVNALLAALPRLAEDLDPPTPLALIADPYRVAKVSDFGTRPDRLPALYVLPDGPVTLQGEVTATHRAASSVAVAVRVIVADPDAAGSHRYAAYVLRALEQSVARFLGEDAPARAAREQGAIQILMANTLALGPWRESVGDAAAVAVLVVDFAVRDTLPTG